jgi:hypothetical protein
VLCLCVNLLPAKYYVAPVGSPLCCTRMSIMFSVEYYAVPLRSVTYVASLTGLGSIAKMQAPFNLEYVQSSVCPFMMTEPFYLGALTIP